MFLRAGLLSLGLLLLSRVLGLVRESAQAAAFGASAHGDLSVLMLSLPDWLAGLLAGGTLSYVLLPHWAAQAAQQQARTLALLSRWLLLLGLLLAATLLLQRDRLIVLLVPGLPAALHGAGANSLAWSAVALPAALLAALWTTRLQFQRDFTGLYSAHLLVNLVLVAALATLAWRYVPEQGVAILGASLLAAMLARLGWLGWRMRRAPTPEPAVVNPPERPMPPPAVWLWAALAAGLPLALPFAARSLASQAGEGALATFNYAWKLVELPLVLAIQLVASLAFPGIALALARSQGGSAPGGTDADAGAAIRAAFALAWTLACAAAAALLVGAPAIAQLLFGWGRMGAVGLAQVAAWGAAGAWGLLPQALVAVALTVLAGQSRMKAPGLAYGAALAVLLLAGAQGASDGLVLMWLLNAAWAGVALVGLAALGRAALAHWLPWRAMWAPLLVLAAAAAGSALAPVRDMLAGTVATLALSGVAATVVIAAGWLAGADLRRALRR